MFKRMIFIGLCFFISINLCIAPKKSYTILTYIAGDNNLEPFIDINIKSMMKGANDNANILAFVNRKVNGKKIAKQLLVQNNLLIQDSETFFNLDSGNPNTAIKAIEWAFTNYPADHYMLILWDHGSGSLNRNISRAVCYDDSTGSCFKDFDLVQILKSATSVIGKKLDILAFDACLMADIEIAYTVMPYVNYMVASQETIPGYGYDYNGILSKLKTNLNPQDFCRAMVDAYANFYKTTSNTYTLSALDLSKIQQLTDCLDNIVELLISNLQIQKNKNVTKVIMHASGAYRATRFDDPDILDLYDFLSNLNSLSAELELTNNTLEYLQNKISECLSIIKSCVLHNLYSNHFSGAYGISIYFPFKKVDYAYKTLVWYKNTKWADFLNIFFQSLKK